MAIVVDGITFPELPTEVNGTLLSEAAPYMAMFRWINTSNNEVLGYCVHYFGSEAVYCPAELSGGDEMLIAKTDIACAHAYEVSQPEKGWVFTRDKLGAPTVMMDGIYVSMFVVEGWSSKFELVWSNYDIKTMTSIDATTMTWTTGDEIYFPNSEAPAIEYEAEYFMSSDWFVKIANHARRIGSVSGKLTPDVILSTLQGAVSTTEE